MFLVLTEDTFLYFIYASKKKKKKKKHLQIRSNKINVILTNINKTILQIFSDFQWSIS